MSFSSSGGKATRRQDLIPDCPVHFGMSQTVIGSIHAKNSNDKTVCISFSDFGTGQCAQDQFSPGRWWIKMDGGCLTLTDHGIE
jgi:hypothetical protein